MIRLGHILHPFRSAHSLYRQLDETARRHLAELKFRRIRRGSRDRCWCGGLLSPFKWHRSYGVCTKCGCHVNRRPPIPEELERLYSFDMYWHARQQVKRHPLIEDRTTYDRSDGRVDYWLGLIQRYAPPRGRVVEVGCAHGVLLAELRTRGYDCIGVEPDPRTAQWASRQTGLDIRSGFFPGVSLPICDLFLAFDVIEHAPDPEAFMRGAAKLTRKGGAAIIQTPVISEGGEPPFGQMFEKVFDDVEHLYIFTSESLDRLAENAGFRPVALERWRPAHEIITLERE